MSWDPPKFNIALCLLDIMPIIVNYKATNCENSNWNVTRTCLIPMTTFNSHFIPGTKIMLEYRLMNQFGWSHFLFINSNVFSSSDNAPVVVREPMEVVDIYMGEKTSNSSIHVKWLSFKSLLQTGGLNEVDYRVYWGDGDLD